MRTKEHNLYGLDGEIEGTCTVLPDADIAQLGKRPQGTVTWVCGDFVEEISTSSLWLTGIAPDHTTGGKPPLSDEEINKRCATRAQKNVRRIVNTNRFRFMWTFTFAPYKEGMNTLETQAQKDYHEVRKQWKKFLRKVYKAEGKFPWLVVLELHDSTETSDVKRGTYHLHFATNKRLNWKKTGMLWGLGFVRFDDFQKPMAERGGEVRNPGAYMSKYIGKAFDKQTRGLKRFSCSRDIKRPAKLSGEGLEKFLSTNQTTMEEVFKQERVFECKDAIYGVCQRTYKLHKTPDDLNVRSKRGNS